MYPNHPKPKLIRGTPHLLEVSSNIMSQKKVFKFACLINPEWRCITSCAHKVHFQICTRTHTHILVHMASCQSDDTHKDNMRKYHLDYHTRWHGAW